MHGGRTNVSKSLMLEMPEMMIRGGGSGVHGGFVYDGCGCSVGGFRRLVLRWDECWVGHNPQSIRCSCHGEAGDKIVVGIMEE